MDVGAVEREKDLLSIGRHRWFVRDMVAGCLPPWCIEKGIWSWLRRVK